MPALPQGRVLPAPNRPRQELGFAGSGAVAAAGAAARYHRRSAERAARGRRAAARSRGGQNAAIPPGANPALPRPAARTTPAEGRAGRARDLAARRRGGAASRRRHKIINKKASFSGLDKITGRIINFDEDIGETVQFGALRVKTDACYTRPATEAANTDAFVEVDEITLQGEVKRIFSGWMYAASPGLHGVEHPIYDIWLTDCKGPEQTIVSAAPTAPTPAPAPPPAQKRPPPQKQAAPRPPPQPQFQQQQPPPPPPQQQRPGGLFGGLFGN